MSGCVFGSASVSVSALSFCFAAVVLFLGIASLHGISGSVNSSGEEQKKLDVFANDVFINCLTFSVRTEVANFYLCLCVGLFPELLFLCVDLVSSL